MNDSTNGWQATTDANVSLLWEDGVPVRVSVTGEVDAKAVKKVLASLGWSADVSDRAWSAAEGEDESVQSIEAQRVINVTLSDDVSSYGDDCTPQQVRALQERMIELLEERGYAVNRKGGAHEDSWVFAGDETETDQVDLRQEIWQAACESVEVAQ